MNTPWIIGCFLAIGFFAAFEALAFRHPGRQNTLSMAIYEIGSRWPLSIWVMGVFCGGLATHFFWHWCPPGAMSVGEYPFVLPNAILNCIQTGCVTAFNN